MQTSTKRQDFSYLGHLSFANTKSEFRNLFPAHLTRLCYPLEGTRRNVNVIFKNLSFQIDFYKIDSSIDLCLKKILDIQQ